MLASLILAAAAARPTVFPVAVPADPDSAHAAAVAGFALEQVLKKDAGHELVPTERLAPATTSDAGTALARARTYVQRAHLAYDNLDFSSAATLLDKAVSELEKTNLVEHWGELSAALVLRAAARFFGGDVAGGQAEVERLVGMDPAAAFDPKVFSPDLLDVVAKARKSSGASAKEPLDVRCDPPARVYVDGVYRGISPVSVKALTPGEHYVTVFATGYLLGEKLGRSGPGQSTRFHLDEAPGARGYLAFLSKIATGWGDQAGADAARDLGRAAGADEVMAILASHEGRRTVLKVQRVAVSDGHLLADGSGGAETDAALAQAAQELSFGAVAHDRPREATGAAVAIGEVRGIHVAGLRLGLDRESIALYSGALSGLALVTGLVTGALASNNASTLHLTAQTDPSVDTLVSHGRAEAVTADVCFVVTVVGGGAWALLHYQPWKLLPRSTPQAKSPPSEEKPPEPKPPPPPGDDPFSTQLETPLAPAWSAR